MDVIIGLGYDGSPNSDDFKGKVMGIIDRFGTLNAEIVGMSRSPEWGAEEGCWFAASFADLDTFSEAQERILVVGSAHNQDAIAFTIGFTEVAACSPAERASAIYRDFL